MVHTPCTHPTVHTLHVQTPLYTHPMDHTPCTGRTTRAWWYRKPIFFPQPCKRKFVSVQQTSCCVAKVRFVMSETRVAVMTLRLQLILHSSVSVWIRRDNRKSISEQNFFLVQSDQTGWGVQTPGGSCPGITLQGCGSWLTTGLRMRGTTNPPPLIFTGWRSAAQELGK